MRDRTVDGILQHSQRIDELIAGIDAMEERNKLEADIRDAVQRLPDKLEENRARLEDSKQRLGALESLFSSLVAHRSGIVRNG